MADAAETANAEDQERGRKERQQLIEIAAIDAQVRREHAQEDEIRNTRQRRERRHRPHVIHAEKDLAQRERQTREVAEGARAAAGKEEIERKERKRLDNEAAIESRLRSLRLSEDEIRRERPKLVQRPGQVSKGSDDAGPEIGQFVENSQVLRAHHFLEGQDQRKINVHQPRRKTSFEESRDDFIELAVEEARLRRDATKDTSELNPWELATDFMSSESQISPFSQQATDLINENLNIYLNPSELADASSFRPNIPTKTEFIRLYLALLAKDLTFSLRYIDKDPEALQQVLTSLPALLSHFAQKVTLESDTQASRDCMLYIDESRVQLAETVERSLLFRSDRHAAIVDGMQVSGKVESWFQRENKRDDSNQSHNSDDCETSDYSNSSDPSDHEVSLAVKRYQEWVKQTAAYEWLKVSVKTVSLLTWDQKPVLVDIQKAIVACSGLSNGTKFANFEIGWNVGHDTNNMSLLEGIITLTGSPMCAQALPLAQYMRLVWPLTSRFTLDFTKDILAISPGQMVSKKATTRMLEGIEIHGTNSGSTLSVTVRGLQGSLEEICEQLTWLGANLHKSRIEVAMEGKRLWQWPSKRFMRLCSPRVIPIDAGIVSLVSIKYSFENVEDGDSNWDNRPGECWQNLFSNSVLVRGFPISRKPVGHKHAAINQGLEMPLNMMAALAGARRLHDFDSIFSLKGFSTMLVPTMKTEGCVLWHLLCHDDGSRIPYYEQSKCSPITIDDEDLSSSRHILGWCRKTTIEAGTIKANYEISRSKLKPPNSQCLLEKVQFTGGKYIQATMTFAIGNKNLGLHVPRRPYLMKMHSMSKKYIIFWDTTEKRGWLLDGATALLHLLRASLKLCEADALKTKLLSKHSDLVETDPIAKPEFALEMLTDERNMKLKIYPDKDDIDGETRKQRYYCLEDRVEELYEMLEKLCDVQVQKQSAPGYEVKAHARRHLEGWDFKDLASSKDLIKPKVEILHTSGKGWVDFARKINAVTLFGRGFGEIIQSTCGTDAVRCLPVPHHQYHLTARVANLRNILEEEGNDEMDPVTLCDGLLWFSPRTTFAHCKHSLAIPAQNFGTFRTAKKQSKLEKVAKTDYVQVLWPISLRKRRPNTYFGTSLSTLPTDGAVVFGHNIAHKLLFRDFGDPQIGGDPANEPEVKEDDDLLNVDDSTTRTTSSSLSPSNDGQASSTAATSGQESSSANLESENLRENNAAENERGRDEWQATAGAATVIKKKESKGKRKMMLGWLKW